MAATVNIYALCDPLTLACRYVGKTTNITRRIAKHMHDAANGVQTHKAVWIRSLEVAPVVQVLEYLTLDESNWEDAERWWISEMRRRGCDLTNGTDGGDGGATNTGRKFTPEHVEKIASANRGRPKSDETRQRISAAKMGQVSPRKGVHLTDETKAKLSAAHLGRPSAFLGHTHTAEANARNAAAHIGRTPWNKGVGRVKPSLLS